MAERSNYQKKVIKRYYDNREQIDRQRLGELVTNLYLTTGAKKLATFWETAAEIMQRLGVPPGRIQHVIGTADPAQLAEVVKEIEAGLHRPSPKTG
jgi:hypothetical protein